MRVSSSLFPVSPRFRRAASKDEDVSGRLMVALKGSVKGWRIPEEVLAEVRNRVDIVDVIGRHVRLKKAGRSFKGLCPFHSERSPSFNVNPDRGLYYCFGCGEGGTVFNFLMKVEGLGFRQAVESLAGMAGVEIPKPELDPEAEARAQRRARLYDANRAAQDFFRQRLLQAEDAAPAREYLEERGLSPEVAEAYGVGFGGMDWQGLCRHLQSRDVSSEDAQLLGLVGRSRSGRAYDKFRGRLMFPIVTASGQVVAFGGRVVPAIAALEPDRNHAKYLNSPESPVYNKSRVLYGLQAARDAVRKSGEAVVVEGYMDCIALYQFGVRNAVAPCGTAVTEDQVRLLGRFAAKAFLTFDGDGAGTRAAERAAGLSLYGMLARVGLDDRVGLESRVVTLPQGEDPDSFVRAHGAEGFAQLLEGGLPVVEFLLDRAVQEAGDSIQGRIKAARSLAPVFAELPQGLVRDEYLRLAADRFGIEEGALRRELHERAQAAAEQERRYAAAAQERRQLAPARPPGPPPPTEMGPPPGFDAPDMPPGPPPFLEEAGGAPPAPPVSSGPPPRKEELLVAFLLEHPQLVRRAVDEGVIELISDAALRRVAQRLAAAVRGGEAAEAGVELLISEGLVGDLRQRMLRRLAEGTGTTDENEATRWLEDSMAQLRQDDSTRQRARMQQRLKRARMRGDASDEAEKRRLALQHQELRRRELKNTPLVSGQD